VAKPQPGTQACRAWRCPPSYAPLSVHAKLTNPASLARALTRARGSSTPTLERCRRRWHTASGRHTRPDDGPATRTCSASGHPPRPDLKGMRRKACWIFFEAATTSAPQASQGLARARLNRISEGPLWSPTSKARSLREGDFTVAASAVWNLLRRYEEWVRIRGSLCTANAAAGRSGDRPRRWLAPGSARRRNQRHPVGLVDEELIGCSQVQKRRRQTRRFLFAHCASRPRTRWQWVYA
jgi:hypothetical protein